MSLIIETATGWLIRRKQKVRGLAIYRKSVAISYFVWSLNLLGMQFNGLMKNTYKWITYSEVIESFGIVVQQVMHLLSNSCSNPLCCHHYVFRVLCYFNGILVCNDHPMRFAKLENLCHACQVIDHSLHFKPLQVLHLVYYVLISGSVQTAVPYLLSIKCVCVLHFVIQIKTHCKPIA